MQKKAVVEEFLQNRPQLKALFSRLALKERKILEKIILLKEGERVFAFFQKAANPLKKLKKMAAVFLKTDAFYRDLGGIEGYFENFLRLLENTKTNKKDARSKKPADAKKTELLEPAIVDISKKTAKVRDWIKTGLKNLPRMAEIYPVGGSGDRLDLKDKKGRPYPAACLPFLGKSLLAGLIRDLEAREYLYYKTYGKKITVPVVLMTSEAKDNHRHILELLKQNNYFGRGRKSFIIFKQMSVPVISEDKHFVLKNPLALLLKPGGHGVIWKLMEKEKVFSQLLKQKKQKLLLRQINNPVAGLDYGLLAFIGYGIKEKKQFGFASCPRRVNSAEGTDVLKCRKDKALKKGPAGYKYNISNVEYTDFAVWNLKDEPLQKGSLYSKYPANTNILFADLKAVRKAVKKDPFPGMIINLKTKAKDILSQKPVRSGRLELMMQNISDALFDVFKKPITEKQKFKLKTYLSYGERIKTLSSAKRAFDPEKPILETPEGAFYDYLKNMENLFRLLGFSLPGLNSEKDYVRKGPAFSIVLHPALGPLFSDIGKKIRRGRIEKGSELVLDLAEVKIENFRLNGSFIAEAEDLKSSSLLLKNVKISNKGIDRKSRKNCFWQRKLKHKEMFYLKLNENSQFLAEDITFDGPFHLNVLKNQKVTAYLKNNRVVLKKEKIKHKDGKWPL